MERIIILTAKAYAPVILPTDCKDLYVEYETIRYEYVGDEVEDVSRNHQKHVSVPVITFSAWVEWLAEVKQKEVRTSHYYTKVFELYDNRKEFGDFWMYIDEVNGHQMYSRANVLEEQIYIYYLAEGFDMYIVLKLDCRPDYKL